jgi:hypothetical protein
MTWTEPRHRWAVELPSGKLWARASWSARDTDPVIVTWRTRELARAYARYIGGKAIKIDVLYRRAAVRQKYCGECGGEYPGECDGRCERWP